MSSSAVSIMNGLALKSALDYLCFLIRWLFGVVHLKFRNENTHLCVRPFNFTETLFMVTESVTGC